MASGLIYGAMVLAAHIIAGSIGNLDDPFPASRLWTPPTLARTRGSTAWALPVLAFKLRLLCHAGVTMLSGCARGAKSF
jgi:hypothetical protein